MNTASPSYCSKFHDAVANSWGVFGLGTAVSSVLDSCYCSLSGFSPEVVVIE